MKAAKFLVVISLFATVVCAAPTYPITSSYIGVNEAIFIPSNSPGTSNGYNYGSDLGMGGGEFAGTITTNGGTGTSLATAFWCVDDQLYFEPGVSSALANITPIADLSVTNPSTNSQTQYGTLAAAGGTGWTNNLGAGNNTAYARYEMAAYLITQYNGFDTTITGTAQDVAVQQAIWAITNNNSGIAENGSAISAITGNPTVNTTDAYWVSKALSNYQTFASSSTSLEFAVVSWGANSSGVLSTTSSLNATPQYSSGALQTFLVELAPGVVTTGAVPSPEPGLYGMLALGLSGLVLAINRKKKA